MTALVSTNPLPFQQIFQSAGAPRVSWVQEGSPDAAALRQCLRLAGFQTQGDLSGVVENFQRAYNTFLPPGAEPLVPDGLAGPKTLDALRQHLAGLAVFGAIQPNRDLAAFLSMQPGAPALNAPRPAGAATGASICSNFTEGGRAAALQQQYLRALQDGTLPRARAQAEGEETTGDSNLAAGAGVAALRRVDARRADPRTAAETKLRGLEGLVQNGEIDPGRLNAALEKGGIPQRLQPGESLGQFLARSKGYQEPIQRILDELPRSSAVRAAADEAALRPALSKAIQKNQLGTWRPDETLAQFRARSDANYGPSIDKLLDGIRADERTVLNQRLKKMAVGTMREGESLSGMMERIPEAERATTRRVVDELSREGKLPALRTQAQAQAAAPAAPAAHAEKPASKLDSALKADFSPGAAKALKYGGRALVAVGATMDAIDVANAVDRDAVRGDGKHTETIKTGSKVAGGWLGAIGGAAVTGAVAGSVVPGLGNVAGFLIGAGGGALGYFLGSSTGAAVGEAIAS